MVISADVACPSAMLLTSWYHTVLLHEKSALPLMQPVLNYSGQSCFFILVTKAHAYTQNKRQVQHQELNMQHGHETGQPVLPGSQNPDEN